MSTKEKSYASSASTSILLPEIGTWALDDTESELSSSLVVSVACHPKYGDVVDAAILPDLKLDQAIEPHGAVAGPVEQEAVPPNLHVGQTKKRKSKLTSNNLQRLDSFGEPLHPYSAQLQRWLAEPHFEEQWNGIAIASTKADGELGSRKTGSS